MKGPNLAIAGIVAIVAFSAMLLVRSLVDGGAGPWLTDEHEAFTRARAEGKGVVIDLSATWSISSDQLSRAFDGLATELDRHFVRLRIDVSDQDERTESIRARYNAEVTPMVLFVRQDGSLISRIVQPLDEPALRAAIAAAAKLR